MQWSNVGGSISGGGLIAAYCCAGAFSSVRADRAVSSGQHYWELTLSVRPGEQHPDTWTTAGVTTDNKTSPPIMPRSGQSATAITALDRRKDGYRSGDTFMFALDADRGMVFYGLNGQWLNGQPGFSGGTAVGAPGAQFTPFVNISASSSKSGPEGDRWIANFGGSRYKYPIPAGYAAYGTSVSNRVAQAASAQLTGTPDTSSSPVGKIVEDLTTIAGQQVPLPAGKWLGLAYFKGAPNTTSGDSAVFGKVEKGRIVEMVAINAFKHANQKNGFPSFRACDRTDYVHINRDRNDAFGPQRCWWVNHATQIWDSQPIFQAAKGVIEQRNLVAPAVLMNVGYRRANENGFVTAFYYFSPEEAGIQTPATTWSNSEWHKDRIANDPKRTEYIKELLAWGKSWAHIFFAYN